MQLIMPGIATRGGSKQSAMIGQELIVDSFAGGGGASMGIEAALGRCVDVAINHDAEAIEIHARNHPHTKHYCENVWTIDPPRATGGRPVGLAWFSPDCKHFSRAKGAKPVDQKIRGLAWIALRWAARARPRIIMLENVREFLDWGPLNRNNRPIKSRKGETFTRWTWQLRELGYRVEWRVLNAADYGAPTHRRRLFVIARNDDRPIVWPEPTHGPGRARRYHTAAECIDWSLPCPSIFERKRPLAEKTLRRIAQGIRKYVIEAADPFIVTCNHSGREFRGQSPREPMRTITAARDAHGLVMPILCKYHGLREGQKDGRANRPDQPLRTQDTQNRFALVEAFLLRWFGQSIGQPVDRPAPTSTAQVNKSGLVTAHLTKFYRTNVGADMRDPLPTITAGCQHLAEVRAFLIKYYSSGGQDQRVDRPIDTITPRHRFGLVIVAGVEYQIADIGLRMLEPQELKLAQFGVRHGPEYILWGSKAAQIRMIGNSVPPDVVEAVVAANCQGLKAGKEIS